jgi:hypothetical protein
LGERRRSRGSGNRQQEDDERKRQAHLVQAWLEEELPPEDAGTNFKPRLVAVVRNASDAPIHGCWVEMTFPWKRPAEGVAFRVIPPTNMQRRTIPVPANLIENATITLIFLDANKRLWFKTPDNRVLTAEQWQRERSGGPGRIWRLIDRLRQLRRWRQIRNDPLHRWMSDKIKYEWVREEKDKEP